MPTHDIRILPSAREDIAKVYYYVAVDRPDAAQNLTDLILDKIDTLSMFPERCPFVPDGTLAREGYRMLVVDSYIVFFKVMESTVIVYRVLHGRRDYPHLLGSE